MSNIIAAIEKEQINKNIPDFKIGDTIVVHVKVKEGNRERLQAFEGVVIAKRNRGLNSAFTVRKVSHGEGVERVFQMHSPLIASIKVLRKGDVRRAKLYYLRELSGRAARIKEKISRKNNEGGIAEELPIEVPDAETLPMVEEQQETLPAVEETASKKKATTKAPAKKAEKTAKDSDK